MTTSTGPVTPADQGISWYGLTADEVCRELDVDPAVRLSSSEVEERRRRYGPNKLAEEAKEPVWKAFLLQDRDLLQLVLVGPALVSIIALHDLSTGLVVLGLTDANALMGPPPRG